MERSTVYSFSFSLVVHIAIIAAFYYFVYAPAKASVWLEQSSITVDLREFFSEPNGGEDSATTRQNNADAERHESEDPIISDIKANQLNHKAEEKVNQQKNSGGDVSSSGFQNSGGASPNYSINAPPEYPLSARRLHQEGTVTLSVAVDMQGIPSNVGVKETSGFEVLDNSAVTAVSKWKFSPATMGGVPVVSQVEVPVRFKLK